jgi:hypothetical protein
MVPSVAFLPFDRSFVVKTSFIHQAKITYDRRCLSTVIVDAYRVYPVDTDVCTVLSDIAGMYDGTNSARLSRYGGYWVSTDETKREEGMGGWMDGVTEEGKEEWPIQWEVIVLEIKEQAVKSLGHGDRGWLGSLVQWSPDIGCKTNKLWLKSKIK